MLVVNKTRSKKAGDWISQERKIENREVVSTSKISALFHLVEEIREPMKEL